MTSISNGFDSVSPPWKKGVFGGVTYNYLYVRPSGDKATFLLLHGFPNGPSNYEDFMPELTSRGYGVVLPELLGYGETDRPTDLEAYAFRYITSQLTAILDAEGVEKVIALGHDFGGPLAARYSQFYPERVHALVLGGPPYAPPSPTALDVNAFIKQVKPVLGYENIGYFNYFSRDYAPEQLDEHLDTFLSVMFGPPTEWKENLCKSPPGGMEAALQRDQISQIEEWFTTKQWIELVAYLHKNGMLGPCMWFRAAVSNINNSDYGRLDPRITKPFLYINPTEDPTYPLKIAAAQDKLCDDITTKTIKTGHWIFEQDPKGAAEIVLAWGEDRSLF